MTSSAQACSYQRPENHRPVIDETMWSDETIPDLIPYTRAKILQEKVLWKVAAEYKAKG